MLQQMEHSLLGIPFLSLKIFLSIFKIAQNDAEKNEASDLTPLSPKIK